MNGDGARGASAINVGEVAEPGTDHWTVVITDPDRDYVVHSIQWVGYSLLRRRVRGDSASSAGAA